MDTQGVIQIITLVILLILSAFFSSAETALSCANKMRIRSLANEGNERAKRVQKIHENYSKMLSAILIGNNIVNIAASSLVTTFTIRLIGNTFVGIATGILTLFVLIFGEIVPKTWAGTNADKIALAYSGIISILMFILTPVIFIVDKIASGIIKLFHMNSGSDTKLITEGELRTYMDVSKEEGVIEHEEHHIINNIFDFSDSIAEDIMIPRIDMTVVASTASYDEVLMLFRKTMYSRLPVYEDTPDNIIGMIHMKDFFFWKDEAKFKIKKLMRDIHYTYEKKKTSDLLMEMRSKAMNLAIVLDEYGSAVGMITMEDLLEEIVGEIRDEYDDDEAMFIRKVNASTYLIDASRKLIDINDTLSLSITSEDYDTLGGIMIEKLDRLPEVNEIVTLDDGITLQARSIKQHRIHTILLKMPVE
ncbi:MAG: HlyC/CorC family transporter [Lachnospiraceae bacterium]|nr:HlyC/CorC family transporter [Lachnospiraceae bacterium]